MVTYENLTHGIHLTPIFTMPKHDRDDQKNYN
jgi:hypothetical protein